MSNIIAGADRFASSRKANTKPTALDELRKTKRISLPDRAILASRLGQIASNLCPERPQTIAKSWFDGAWSGDRWAKRKRLICFPGEVVADAGDEGAYVASGGDWATLIQIAASSVYPAMGSTAEAERARFSRDILRGTAFLPTLNIVPLHAQSAQSLMAMLAEKISDRIDNDTDLSRLWDVCETTPFDIQSYDLEVPNRSGWADEASFEAFAAVRKYAGDSYSAGPLGEASNLAAEVSVFRYRQFDHWGYRFEPSSADREFTWPYPVMRLGLRGHARGGRIFVLPAHFAVEVRPDFDSDEEFVEDVALDWLGKKGLLAGKAFEDLPEIPFSAETGYGWRDFPYELVQSIWLEVRPKADGTPGLWISAWFDDLNHCYPRLKSFDPLAIEAKSHDNSLGFLSMSIGSNTTYEFLDWPSYRADFMPKGEPPAGAVSGLVEPAYEEHGLLAGWIDDLENVELQDMLFRNPEGTRFCPSVQTDSDVPPPCRLGTVAAAIFTNAAGDAEDRIGRVLALQSKTIGSAGLAFHEALLSHHRSVIERMWSD